jgi:geranylgeranyl diphosphate synthase type II
VGALAANATPAQADALEEFGSLLGKAFQIQDDLLDYFSSTEAIGKAVGSDLAMHKATYATLKGRELARDAQARRLEALLDGGSVEEIRALLDAVGVPQAGRRAVEDLANQARACLDRHLPATAGEELGVFAQWILQRTF